MIPKIIHMVWVGPYRIPKRELETRQQIIDAMPDWEHRLWTDVEVADLVMPEHIRKAYDFWGTRRDFVAQCDILRLFLVKEFGGFYFDIDFQIREGMGDLNFDDCDAFLTWHHTDEFVETFPNGVFGSAKDGKLFSYLCDHIRFMEFHTPHHLGADMLQYMGLPKTIYGEPGIVPHLGDDGILKMFDRERIKYEKWEDFHNNRFYHNALYSWDGKNKAKFDADDYE